MAPYLPIDHGDIEEFLAIGSDNHPIQDMNSGVIVDSPWMQSMIDGDSDKRRIWGKLLQARKETGYPYLMFRTNANDQAPEVFRDKGLEINSSNLCVTGDTMVDIAIDGVRKKVPIQQLNDLYQANSSIDVASFNIVTNTIEYKPIVASAMTNPSTKVLKITDTVTGYTIKCTPEHKVYTSNRGYIMAKDLKADDELVLLAN
jgi:hypothetical protein